MHFFRLLLITGICLGTMSHGLRAVAQPPERPAAVQAPEDGATAVEAKPEASSAVSPFELRYIFSYVLMLAFVGGSTFLIIRPSGRKIQGDDGAVKGKGAAKAKK